MVTTTPAQLIRIARLRRFVGVFARGGDRASTIEALSELAHAAREGGLAVDALRRARQAAQLVADEDTGEVGIRALLQLSGACLDAGDAETAAAAADIARGRAANLGEPLCSQLGGCAALLGGIAHAQAGDVEASRAWLEEARERLVAADEPEGAALAITQLGLLDVETGQRERAQVCFLFARDFYRSMDQAVAAAEVLALAARAWAGGGWPDTDAWFSDAIVEADLADSKQLAAELVVERAIELERAGARSDAFAVATGGAARCADLPDAAPLALRARLLLARLAEDPVPALRHVEAAFELALDQRDTAALAAAMEVVVTGLVKERFTDVGWRLVDRFRERLDRAGFGALAETAVSALEELRT